MIPDPLSAVLADRYVLERELGAGGMATVYLAEDVRHHRKVAVKVLHPELAASLGPERFLREIRLTARLDHPHILAVFDSGEAAGLLWYTVGGGSPGAEPARRGVGGPRRRYAPTAASRGGGLRDRYLIERELAGGAQPPTASRPPHHGRAARTNQRAPPATRQVGATFPSRHSFYF